VQRRPSSVSALLRDVSNITVATGHRYVWRGVKNAHFLLHSSLYRRLMLSGMDVTSEALAYHETVLLREARNAGYDYKDGRKLLDGHLLALLQHAGASTSLLDVTPDPFVALFFATEPRGETTPCALIAIKVPGKSEAEQARHTLKGPLPNGWADARPEAQPMGIYTAIRERLELAEGTTAPLLWEAPFVDDRIRVQRGMFLATTVPSAGKKFASFDVDLGSVNEEEARVRHICERDPGKYTRPSLVVFYVNAKLRQAAARELDRRFGYRTETIYPDLAGFAEANASNRRPPS
jgi:FRG domain